MKSLSVQEEIDELGGSKSISAWEARFELACQKCKDENVTLDSVPGQAMRERRIAKLPPNIGAPCSCTSVAQINRT